MKAQGSFEKVNEPSKILLISSQPYSVQDEIWQVGHILGSLFKPNTTVSHLFQKRLKGQKL